MAVRPPNFHARTRPILSSYIYRLDQTHGLWLHRVMGAGLPRAPYERQSYETGTRLLASGLAATRFVAVGPAE